MYNALAESIVGVLANASVAGWIYAFYLDNRKLLFTANEKVMILVFALPLFVAYVITAIITAAFRISTTAEIDGILNDRNAYYERAYQRLHPDDYSSHLCM